MAANPIILVIAAVAALVLGLIYAYENCRPFRDAVNDIARILSGVLTAGFNDVIKIIDLFEGAISKVTNGLKPLESAVSAVGGALSHLCFAHAAPVAEEFNKKITDSIAVTDKLTGKLGELRGGLLEVSSGVEGVGVAGPLGAGVAGAAAAGKQAPVTVNITAPLVQVQGSADITTAAAAANIVSAQLQSIVLKATSPTAKTQFIGVNPSILPGMTPSGMVGKGMSATMFGRGPTL
jgi:hypothetical protein